MENIAMEMAKNQQFQEFWKTLEPAFVGVLPPMLEAFKEVAYRGFVEGFKKGFYAGVDSPFYEPPPSI